MNRVTYWLVGTLAGVAAGAILSANIAKADERAFIPRDTRIAGCIAIIDKVRDGTITPTEWMDANKEEFADLQLELKRRKYAPDKAKAMMMGMAISICMERKGYINKCVADTDSEDADVQTMRTADVYACWTKRRTTEAPRAPLPAPVPAPVPLPVPVPTPQQPDYQPVSLPPMSPADVQQFNEDMSIISQPVIIRGDDEGGAKEARFGSCFSYWQSLHYNRSPEARQVLFSVRVARCMFRTNYAVLPSRCSPTSFGSMLSPRCYARF